MSTPSGTYYIRVRPTGWYVWHQSWKDGKRTQEKVASLAVRDLGFKAEWSVDQAKAHCRQLNKERSLIKEKIRKAAKRVTELKTIDDTLFPAARVAEFQTLLEDENFGSEAHLKKLGSQFLFIQRMCNALRIQPVEYKEHQKQIYKYFIKEKVSVNYACVLVALLNRWGKFVSKINGSFFEVVSVPKGRERAAIADAQQTKRGKESELGVRQASEPLTPELLEECKRHLSDENYRWLLISVWFGLRPEEIDGLKDPKKFKIDFLLKQKIHVLKVYQSKLKSIAADKRWKTIPVITDEQKEVLAIIKAGKFKRPIYKTMRKYVGGGVSLYGGRKGFTDLMLDRGQSLENISLWLGHTDIGTTWRHYKNKDIIAFSEMPSKKSK